MPFCFALGSILPRLFDATFYNPRRKPQAAITCLLLCAVLCTFAEIATAQSKTATSTTLAITSGGTAVSSVAAGTVVTLTAHVNAGGAGVTLGQVNFCDGAAKTCTDIHLQGTAQLSAGGTATVKLRPGLGSHSYKAVFVATDTYAGSASNPSSVTASGKAPTAVALTNSGNPGDYTLTAKVGGQGGASAPSGSVSFLDTSYSNTVVATAELGTGVSGLNFLRSEVIASDNQSTSLAVRDFNGDGIPDLAVASYFDGLVSILLGNGNGTFTPATGSPITGLFDPNAIIVADFNGDGKADLAFKVGYYGGGVAIYLGNGDGTFTQAANSPIVVAGPFEIADAVEAGDFNGDGILDLVVTNDAYVYGPSSVSILLGSGDGTFKPAPTPTVQVGSGPISVAVGDLNGDGFVDLVTANFYDGTATVLLGKGDGSFQQAPNSPITVGKFPYGVALGDLNQDGKLDVAVVNENYTSGNPGSVSVLLGNGDGTFTQAQGSPVNAGNSPQAVAIGDFNSDGVADLAVVNNSDDTVMVLLGTGNGEFTPAAAGPVLVGDFPSSIALGDFTGGGIPDIAVADEAVATATVLMTVTNEATATATGVAPVGTGTHNVEAAYAGDSHYTSSVSGTVALTAGLAPVSITPAGGTFSSVQTVAMTEPIPGASIYYAASGAFNTNGFVQYTGPISLGIGGQETITAYASETGYNQSNNTTVTFTMNFPVAPVPVISPPGGLFAGSQTVTITDSAPGASIYYTTDGTQPTTSSTIYAGPITVSTSEMVAAIAAGGGYSPSSLTSAQFFIQSSQNRLIYTIAGSGFWGFGGDGGPATLATLNDPTNTAVDAAGNLYIADTGNQLVRKVDAATGIISTIAGTGAAGYAGDGGPAVSAQLYYPYAVAIDSVGNLYISDSGNYVVRRVDATSGTISTVAGTGTSGYSGDNGPGAKAMLGYPLGIALDTAGNLYIGDQTRVRMVNARTGVISTIAGNGTYGFSGDGGLATSASLTEARAIAIDQSGNLYIADTFNNVIRKVTASTGIITTVAGQGGSNNSGYSGDGGSATSAKLSNPMGIAIDAAKNIYISDTNNYVLREVTAADGIIQTISGHAGLCTTLSGDGGPASQAGLCYAPGVVMDGQGNLYVSEEGSGRIRKILPAGAPPSNTTAQPAFSLAAGTYATPQTLTITDIPRAEIFVTVNGSSASSAGKGYSGPIGITGTATIQAVAVAPGYLPSTPVSAAYTITTPPTAIINTFAGNGTTSPSGIGGPATSTGLSYPTAIASDGAGNLYVADQGDFVVWKVSATTGTISVAAGIPGVRGYPLPPGPATSTSLNYPQQVAVDKAGNLYISDLGFGEVLKVDANTGIMTVFAGGGYLASPPFGDGGPATLAFLSPNGLTFDSAGNLYVADAVSRRIREVSPATGIITTVAGGGTNGLGDGGPATSATLNFAGPIVFDSKGSLYIGDNGRVRVVNATTGIITTFAGNGNLGASGDGGPATSAEVYVSGLAVDSADNLYISNDLDGIRMVPAGGGTITRVIGLPYFGFAGDGGAATMAQLCAPEGLAFDQAGNLYIADTCNYRVRKVTYNPAPAPVFSLPAGTYSGTQTVTITDAAEGAVLYYTTDGSIPTTSSTVYTAPITVPSSETLKAMALATGYSVSAVASADYLINQKPAPAVGPVQSSLNPSMTGDAVTFTVSVSSSVGSPSGTVTFMDGSVQMGLATLSGGSTTYSTSTLAAGSHSITAVYSGDGTFGSVTSASLTQVVESFSIAPSSGSSSSATASPGGQAKYTLAVTPPGAGSALTFSVSGLPAGATATFSPSTVAAGAGVTNVMLTVTVPASASAEPAVQLFPRGTWPVALGLVLLPFARRRRSASAGGLPLLLLIASLAIGFGVSACGGSGKQTSSPSSQTYTLKVTATSGTLTQSSTLTLVVQ